MFKKPVYFVISVTLFFLTLFVLAYNTSSYVKSVTNHVVISEIQIEGGATSDEFVELYNPKDGAENLENWTLLRKTASAEADEILLLTLSGTIPAHGFYLITHTGFDGGVAAQATYSDSNITDNNTVILRDSDNQIVDLVGMGTSATRETEAVLSPIDNRSIERKALAVSTASDMASGGAHELLGNGEDTDNNAKDFVRHESPTVSNPQNTSSPIESSEITPTVTETPTPTEEPTVTPTESPSPTPTDEPTPTPTEEPSPSPTESPSPTPTDEPSPTPTDELSPTPTETPTPTPEPSPTPQGKIIGVFTFPGNSKICYLNYKIIQIGFFRAVFPYVSCN